MLRRRGLRRFLNSSGQSPSSRRRRAQGNREPTTPFSFRTACTSPMARPMIIRSMSFRSDWRYRSRRATTIAAGTGKIEVLSTSSFASTEGSRLLFRPISRSTMRFEKFLWPRHPRSDSHRRSKSVSERYRSEILVRRCGLDLGVLGRLTHDNRAGFQTTLPRFDRKSIRGRTCWGTSVD